MPELNYQFSRFFNGRKCLSIGTAFGQFGKEYWDDLIPHLLQLDLLEAMQRMSVAVELPETCFLN